jgi:halocyanin-like protein
MNTDEGMNRRDFLRIAGASGAVIGASGTAAAQEGGGKKGGGKNKSSGGGGSAKKGPINYNGYLEEAKGWGGPGSTVDKTGKKKVTVKVGVGSKHRAFGPVAVHVDPGTKVTWKWTGKGGAHNVVSEQDKFKSGGPVAKKGHTYSHTFKKKGINNYYCNPHKPMGMKGSIAVGKVPHKEPITPATPAVSNGARTLGVATFVSMVSTLGLAYFFMKYGGNYEE